MPAIKKQWIKANQNGMDMNEAENKQVVGDEDRELAGDAPQKGISSIKKSKRQSHDPIETLKKQGLDGEILLQKRKRFVPPAEVKLNEWLDEHFERKDDVKLSLLMMYKHYTGLCQETASEVLLDIPAFNKLVKIKFGGTFAAKESSVFKSVLKEHKAGEKIHKVGSGIKLKEVTHEAIKHFGNPYSGVRFFSLKKYVGSAYPALRIDQHPKSLRRALEIGINCGQIELVKGIGMAGFYRLAGAVPPKTTNKEKKKKDGKSAAGEETSKEADSAGSDAQEPQDNEDSAKTEEEQTDKPKPKAVKKCSLKKVRHGNPQKIEDTFPLAITFQSAPKAAGLYKVRRYIETHYNETVPDNKWRKAIENGLNKHSWEYASGSGMSGCLHLLMDDFDPDSEELQDQICAGIIACHEPKSAGANQIKKYISRYHTNFHVDEKPGGFKKALIRAVDKSMIVQLSGIGASGSFMLCETFVPSPRILAGEEEDDEEDDSDEEQVYIPKKTKSRSAPLKLSVKESKKVVPKKYSVLKSMGKGKAKTNAKKEQVAKKSAKTTNKKKSAPARASSSDEEEEDEEVVEYSPKKSKSRGGSVKAPAPTGRKNKSPAKSPKPSSKQKPGRAAKRMHSEVDADDDDSDNEPQPEYTPKKSKSRGTPTPVKTQSSTKTSRGKGTPTASATSSSSSLKMKLTIPKLVVEEDSDSEPEPEYTPRKSSSRGNQAAARTPSRSGKKGRKRK